MYKLLRSSMGTIFQTPREGSKTDALYSSFLLFAKSLLLAISGLYECILIV